MEVLTPEEVTTQCWASFNADSVAPNRVVDGPCQRDQNHPFPCRTRLVGKGSNGEMRWRN